MPNSWVAFLCQGPPIIREQYGDLEPHIATTKFYICNPAHNGPSDAE
jgi:hypothetical protein